MSEREPLSEPNIYENQAEMSDKEKSWQGLQERFKNETDGLGKEIEPKIMDVVIGLNALEIGTYQSCEGHIDRGDISPWVDIEAPGAPETKYKNPEKSKKEIYKECGISQDLLTIFKQLDKKFNQEAKKRKLNQGLTEERQLLAKELIKETGVSDEDLQKWQKAGDWIYKAGSVSTEEFEEWLKKTEEVVSKAEVLVEEFNKDRTTPEDIRIKLKRKISGASARILSGEIDYGTARQKRSLQEKQELAQRLTQYQEEFAKFAEFLKEKYFEE